MNRTKARGGTAVGKLWRAILLPEANLFLFGLLLNFPWEILQAPLFEGMAGASHSEATKTCAVAALGDAAILVLAYWVAAVAARSRCWLQRPVPGVFAVYLLSGLGVSLTIERLATDQGRWAYAAIMPVVPVLDIGLAPIAQWVLLPPLALWIAHRQAR